MSTTITGAWANRFNAYRKVLLGVDAVLTFLDANGSTFSERRTLTSGWSVPESVSDPATGFDGYRIQIADVDLSLLPDLRQEEGASVKPVQYLAIAGIVYEIVRRPKRPVVAPYLWQVDLQMTDKRWP
jgi:hypothetical protein